MVHHRRIPLIRVITMVLASLPVAAFFMIIGLIIWNSRLAFTQVGLSNLFSEKISTPYSGIYIQGQFGLLPAIQGTVMLVILSIVIAFPLSLAMAVAASEFSIGWLGRPLELLLSVFAGIPPIIYGMLSGTVLYGFIRPKFAGTDLAESLIKTLPGLPAWNSGMLPENLSSLLGIIMMALLIIPFIAPLILDALRNVPQSQKEASLALGANRWHTLWRVTLPAATPGIVIATTLGILKIMGDVVLVAWTIGPAKDNGLPAPIWDFFEHNSPLAATAASVLGGLLGNPASSGAEFSVAHFAAGLLMIFAFLILTLGNLISKWVNRRYSS